ncbi:hypothetical protein J4450_00390 [Candidatus Micrarchaeota archaeon]|nr:hypothetical protein [Candidatus Micrarchaeota archaeon]
MTSHIFDIQGFIDRGGDFAALFPDWTAALAAALITSLMLLTFIYLIGVILRNQGTIGFVKLELFELIMSAILVVFIISAVAMMNSLTVGSIFPHGHHPDDKIYKATQQYYIEVGDMIIGWMETDYLFGVWTDNLASATPYSRPLGVGIVAAPLAGFAAPLKQIIYNINSALTIAYIINTAQRIVFEFAVVGFLKFYIPLGLVLRSFTPTRRLGGALIAIGLGFLFIVPFVTIINAQIVLSPDSPIRGMDDAVKDVACAEFGDYLPGCPDPTPSTPPSAGTPATPSVAPSLSTEKQVESFVDILWNLTIGNLVKLGEIFQNFFGTLFAVAFFVPLTVVGIAFAVGYLLPALNVLVLVQAVKYMSKSLGEEVDITTLTRMI